MSLLSLKVTPATELSEKSRDLTEDEFGEELDSHMSDMLETMYAHTGVGLAGVQVGDLRRILVADSGYIKYREYGKESIKMVNPEVIEASDEMQKTTEGCLSFPGLETFVSRPAWVIVKYKTPLGEEMAEKFDGYLARIILHEMDHLDGVTLFDHMSKLKKKRYNAKLIKSLKKLGEGLKKRAGL